MFPDVIMPAKIIKFIPSRIGEPLTAVGMGNDVIVFGSISGYLGYFILKDGQVIYDETTLFNVR